MQRARPTLLVVTCALAVGCTAPKPVPGSKDVEIVPAQRVDKDWTRRCERLGDVSTELGAYTPEDTDNMRSTEVSVRNKAYEKGATHVAVEPERTHTCPTGFDSVTTCHHLPATAYKCTEPPDPTRQHHEQIDETTDTEDASWRDDVVTLEQAAEICGTWTSVIERAVSSEKISSIEVETDQLMPRSEVLEFCYRRQQASSPPATEAPDN